MEILGLYNFGIVRKPGYDDDPDHWRISDDLDGSYRRSERRKYFVRLRICNAISVVFFPIFAIIGLVMLFFDRRKGPISI